MEMLSDRTRLLTRGWAFVWMLRILSASAGRAVEAPRFPELGVNTCQVGNVRPGSELQQHFSQHPPARRAGRRVLRGASKGHEHDSTAVGQARGRQHFKQTRAHERRPEKACLCLWWAFCFIAGMVACARQQPIAAGPSVFSRRVVLTSVEQGVQGSTPPNADNIGTRGQERAVHGGSLLRVPAGSGCMARPACLSLHYFSQLPSLHSQAKTFETISAQADAHATAAPLIFYYFEHVADSALTGFR